MRVCEPSTLSLSTARIRDIVGRFAGARLAVVGDYLVDVYVDATPLRLSREAPVMVARHDGERRIPGGAANAVANLDALGATVIPFGIIGADAEGERLRAFFRERGLSDEGLVGQDDFPTVTKTRIMVGEEGRSRQQLLRLDREPPRRIDDDSRAALMDRLVVSLPAVDGVLLSDYGYGLLDDGLLRHVFQTAKARPVFADSRFDLERFRGATLVTPNHSEAAQLVGTSVSTAEETEQAGRALLERLAVEALLITRGNKGMMLLERGGAAADFIAAAEAAGEVTDVSGAGDTVVALMALARVAGASYREAARLANAGAGVVVTKLGAATVDRNELMRAAGIDSID